MRQERMRDLRVSITWKHYICVRGIFGWWWDGGGGGSGGCSIFDRKRILKLWGVGGKGGRETTEQFLTMILLYRIRLELTTTDGGQRCAWWYQRIHNGSRFWVISKQALNGSSWISQRVLSQSVIISSEGASSVSLECDDDIILFHTYVSGPYPIRNKLRSTIVERKVATTLERNS